jgi:hypothetical protein
MLKQKINTLEILKGKILNLITELINALNIKEVSYNLKVE